MSKNLVAVWPNLPDSPQLPKPSPWNMHNHLVLCEVGNLVDLE